MSIVERAYLSAGGDIVERASGQYFRFDIENHGRTAAFIKAYALEFRTGLGPLRRPPPRQLGRVKHIDGISPNGARKSFFPDLRRPSKANAVIGAVWYHDVWGKEHVTGFALTIVPVRNIPGHGWTRVLGDAHPDYWMRT